MPNTDTAQHRTLDVRSIEPQQRHAVIPKLFASLGPGASLELIVDHDPRPLHYYLESTHGDALRWDYLEQGPELWRVRLEFLRDAA